MAITNPVPDRGRARGARLIANQFGVDFSRKLEGSGGGLPAFAAIGPSALQRSIMAVQVQRGWPARHRALGALQGAFTAIEGVALPLGHGPMSLPDESEGYFVVCTAPAGRALSQERTPWPEDELVRRLLRPAASALMALEQRGVTHRAIRPDNVFLWPSADSCTLGCAWAAPPAAHQPPGAEPPYASMCNASSRGEGTTADDVYALGALMIRLALGTDPLEGLSPDAVIARKLDVGSFAALTAGHRLAAGVADLVRGMVADEPEHRPSPALLADPAALRARRLASRPTRRAPRPIEVAGVVVHTPRSLAFVITRQASQSLLSLRNGAVAMWLRRIVGDPAMAARVTEAVAQHSTSQVGTERRADIMLLMSTIAILDPLAPMFWGEALFWPDGLGNALDHAQATEPDNALHRSLLDAAASGTVVAWATLRPGRADAGELRSMVRQHQQLLMGKPTSGGPLRLGYALCPLSPCGSRMVGPHWVTRLIELLPAIESTMTRRQTEPLAIDRALIAFLVARKDERIDSSVSLAIGMLDGADARTGLRLFARLQVYYQAGPLPAIAAWASEGVGEALDRLFSQTRREMLARRLAEAVAAGDLAAIVSLIDDPHEPQSDAAGHAAALSRIDVITHALSCIEADMEQARSTARRTGQDVAYAAGIIACGGSLAWVLLG